MKTLILIICLLVPVSLAFAGGAPGSRSSACLKIEGKLVDLDEDEDECLVELIRDNKTLQAVVLKKGHETFKFVLDRNSFYAIKISRKKYITKHISVNTEMPEDNHQMTLFKFETFLLKESLLQGLNEDAVDFPVAIVHFDAKKKCFAHNAKYTSYIKQELHKPAEPKAKKTENPAADAPLASAQAEK